MAEGQNPRSRSEEFVKLFVGQVPKLMTESQILALFNNFAVVEEVNIIKDKSTRASRGCCFIVCPSREEADKVIDACHNKQTLPGASSPLQVKYADGELERLENKLFVGMLPKNVSEVEVSELFAKYGNITDLQILRGSQQTSKGCAFIKYEKKDQAIAAIDALNGIHKMEGSAVPLVVKWADTEKERQARKAQKTQSFNIVDSPQHPSMFGPMGYISPYNNGYGYQAPGSFGIMPYRLPPVQNQQAFHNLIPPVNHENSFRATTSDVSPGMSPRSYVMSPASYMGPTYPAGGPGPHYPMAYTTGMMNGPPSPIPPSSSSSSTGPPGANLFIYNIPQEYGDEELANSFQQFGTVLSAKVYVDKATGNSKCFGFVSYDNPAAAQAAIKKMNGLELSDKKLKVELKRENNKQSNKSY